MYHEQPSINDRSSSEPATPSSSEEVVSPCALPTSPEVYDHSQSCTPEVIKPSAWPVPQTPPTNVSTSQQDVSELNFFDNTYNQWDTTAYVERDPSRIYTSSVYYNEAAPLEYLYSDTHTATPQGEPVHVYDGVTHTENLPMQSVENHSPCIDPHLNELALQATFNSLANQQAQVFYPQIVYPAYPAPQQSLVAIDTQQFKAAQCFDVSQQPDSPVQPGNMSPSVSPRPAYSPRTKHHDQRAFPCLFEFAGCCPAKALHSKNEWKRHMWSFHFQEAFWVCNNERTTAHGSKFCNTVFNRKDSIKHHHFKSCLKHEYETCTDKRILERYIDDAKVDREQYHSPAELHCLFTNCKHKVSGDHTVNNFLEHLWTHLTTGEELVYNWTSPAWNLFVDWTVAIGTLTIDIAGRFWAMPPRSDDPPREENYNGKLKVVITKSPRAFLHALGTFNVL